MERFIVVGCGSIGERHIRCLRSCEGVRVTPCDPRDERLAQMQELYGTEPGLTDYADANLDDFDGVLICTPSDQHIPQALRAVESGCHVFVEKPISVTIDGVNGLLAAALERNLVVQVGYVLRHNPHIREAHDAIAGGRIGRVHMADVCVGSYIPDFRPDYRNLYWAKRATGGGVLYDASHELDLVNWLAGPIREVACFADHFMLDVDGNVDDGAALVMRTEAGAIVSLMCADMQRNYKRGGQIVGSQGTVEYSYDENRVSIYDAETRAWTHRTKVYDRDAFYINQMQDFVGAVRGEHAPLVSGEDGKRALATALAGYVASDERRIVSLSEVNG